MLRIIFYTIAMSIAISLTAQDTLKIMQYNLLYYGKTTGFCNTSNNNQDDKNGYLATILDYAKPDIFCVNEMDASSADVDYLMDNALNINGVTHWDHANVSGSYLINMMYYNSEKYNLISQASINGDPRQTDVYNMELVSDNSIQFTLFVTHLKASYGSDEEARRAYTTQNIMNYIASRGVGNYMVMGDFNVYDASEEGFQNLINPSDPSIAFNDPVNRIGSWSSNYSFADVHTQSTHTSSGCHAGGGMDDRFDFILISDPIKNGTDKIEYIANSYETIGQDGNHYNDNITDGINNSAPSAVISALYHMSDHLPISLEVKLTTNSNPDPQPVTVFNKTFDDQDLTSGGWQQYSVLDDTRIWNVPSNTYGHNSTYYCKMTGWDYDNNVSVENEDWLISPSFNANEVSSEVLTFWTSGKYTGNDLQVYYSTDYSGSGSPTTATWTEITGFNLSTTTDYTWETSGNIDLSQISAENLTIGFKYTSTAASGSRSWQIDDILLEGMSDAASIDNYLSSASFTLYPNPAKHEVLLKIENERFQQIRIELYDLSGHLLKQIETQKQEFIIPTADLDRGVYLIRIGDKTQKLILE